MPGAARYRKTCSVIVRTWDEVLATLRSRTEVPAALASAELLARAQPNWEGRVLPDLWWLHDLRFVRPRDTGPQVEEVRVSWDGDSYVFTLLDDRGIVVTADHASEAATEVLDSFLLQLVETG